MAATFLHRTIGLLAAVGIWLLSLPGTAPAQGQDCAVPASFYDTEPTLPKTAEAIASGQTVAIVALGSASTLGQAAGSPDLAWPARLAVALRSRFPAARVTVDNRAVAHQTSQEGSHLLDREVIALKPTLVIWETGTTDAVTRFTVPLPNTARAIRRGKALSIVAIGSSSTQGVGASDQAHTYPASRLYDCIGQAMADFITRGVHLGAGIPGVSSGSNK